MPTNVWCPNCFEEMEELADGETFVCPECGEETDEPYEERPYSDDDGCVEDDYGDESDAEVWEDEQ